MDVPYLVAFSICWHNEKIIFVVLFVKEATQYFIHVGLQQMKGSHGKILLSKKLLCWMFISINSYQQVSFRYSLYLDTILITLVQTFTISYIEHSMYHQKHCLIKTQGWMHTVAQQTITVMVFLSWNICIITTSVVEFSKL